MTDSHNIKTLTTTFNLPIEGRDLPHWRGAFIEMTGLKNDLFHNHNNSPKEAIGARQIDEHSTVGAMPSLNGHVATMPPPIKHKPFYYRYPLIQYRIIKGKAAIFAINEGITAIQQVLATTDWTIKWSGKPFQLQIEGLDMKEHHLQLTKASQSYRLKNWMAFNDKNFQLWQQSDNLHERVDLLERILPGQILNFFDGAGWRRPERFDLQLQFIEGTKWIPYHDVKRLTLDIVFTANLSLPFGIALGKAVSHGFGCCHRLP